MTTGRINQVATVRRFRPAAPQRRRRASTATSLGRASSRPNAAAPETRSPGSPPPRAFASPLSDFPRAPPSARRAAAASRDAPHPRAPGGGLPAPTVGRAATNAATRRGGASRNSYAAAWPAAMRPQSPSGRPPPAVGRGLQGPPLSDSAYCGDASAGGLKPFTMVPRYAEHGASRLYYGPRGDGRVRYDTTGSVSPPWAATGTASGRIQHATAPKALKRGGGLALRRPVRGAGESEPP